MKKALLILSLLGVFFLASCDKDEEHLPEDGTETPYVEEQSEPIEEEAYSLIFKDTEIAVNDEVIPIVNALGEPTSYFESNSCAFQGLDKVYTYGSVIIRTYPKNDKDYVLSIELKDDSVSTPEGICIGNSPDLVENVYGKADQQTDTSLIYKKGDSVLTFIMKNDEVYSITYTTVH